MLCVRVLQRVGGKWNNEATLSRVEIAEIRSAAATATATTIRGAASAKRSCCYRFVLIRNCSEFTTYFCFGWSKPQLRCLAFVVCSLCLLELAVLCGLRVGLSIGIVQTQKSSTLPSAVCLLSALLCAKRVSKRDRAKHETRPKELSVEPTVQAVARRSPPLEARGSTRSVSAAISISQRRCRVTVQY